MIAVSNEDNDDESLDLRLKELQETNEDLENECGDLREEISELKGQVGHLNSELDDKNRVLQIFLDRMGMSLHDLELVIHAADPVRTLEKYSTNSNDWRL